MEVNTYPILTAWSLYTPKRVLEQDPFFTESGLDRCDVKTFTLPLTNPEGQGHENLWRKNRSGAGESNAIGVDINRHYREPQTLEPILEPLTNPVAPRLLDLHSGCQEITYPWK